MARRSSLVQLLVVSCALACVAEPDFAAEGKIAALDETWRWVSNARFEVLTNGSESRARKVIEELETYRAAIRQMMGGQVSEPPQPVRVLLFDRVWDMAPYQPLTAQGKPETWAGYFLHHGPQTYFALSNESEIAVPSIVFAGYAYRLTAELLRSQPDWLRSGFTEYLSEFRYVKRERRAEIGRPIGSHLRYLNASTHATLRQIVEMTDASPAFAQDVPRSLFFAKSWLLVHYLQVGSPERAGALARFAQLHAQGVGNVEALEKATGVSLVALDQELSVYQRKSLMSFATLVLDPPAPERVEARTAEPADAIYRLGEYLLALDPNRRADAEAHFAAAGRAAPAAPREIAVLPPPAPSSPPPTTNAPQAPEPRPMEPADERSLDELRTAMANGESGRTARLRFVALVEESARHDWVAALPDLLVARAALRALALESPEDESLWRRLSQLYSIENQPADRDEGISTFTSGLELAPRVDTIVIGLTKLLFAKGDDDRARAVIEAAIARSPASAPRFDPMLVDLDIRAAHRLADAGDYAAGLRLLEARVRSVSPAQREAAEVSLARYRSRLEGDRVKAAYEAAVALVNAQKIEEGGRALRELIAAHPDSPYADVARRDLEQVDAYLARRRSRQRTGTLPPDPPPPPPG